MSEKNIISTLFALALVLSSIAQDEKEVVKGGNTFNQMTISKTGMYGGTSSVEAKKYFDKAYIFDEKKNYSKAIKFYNKAISEDVNYVEAYDNLGLVYRRIGNYNLAIINYNKSIALFPNGDIAHQNLAVVYGIRKDYENSIKEYEELLRISPDNPEGYFGLANTYMTIEKYDEALINAEKALKIYQETNSNFISDGYLMIGLIYYYMGDIENARKYMLLTKENGGVLQPQLEREIFGN